MEFVFLAAGLNTLLPRLWEGRKAKSRVQFDIESNVEDITTESKRLKAALGDEKFKGDFSSGFLELKRDAKLLIQATQDCVQRFSKDKNASCMDFATMTEAKIKAIQDLCVRVEGHSPMASEKPDGPFVANPMGMEEPVEELLKLVLLSGRPSDEGRKVISIVGFPGLGKSILANLVFDYTAPEKIQSIQGMPAFTFRATVTAAARDASEVLREILKKVDHEGTHDKLNLWSLGKLLAKSLEGKRYFIVIDDMQSKEQWQNMKYAFPKGGGGTIIVTTTIQSVANVCSPWNGYVYNLSPLDDDKSLDLFLEDRTLWNRRSMNHKASDILRKCDGLGLALVSMSLSLHGSQMGEPTSDDCRAVCTQLGGNLLHEGGDLKRLRWVLMNKYTGLTCDAIRSCLLYYCMYKHNMDAVPRRNSLMRRWDAEGFLVPEHGSIRPTDVAAENLKILVDQNIIQSMEVGTNGRIRRCRPPELMVEYISQVSVFEKFAALVSHEVPCDIRRLSFHPGSATDDGKISDIKLKDVLTLAVSGTGCDDILDFKKYDLIAVLDLKECSNLTDSHVKDISKLLLLKYLSLGVTIGKIPSEIENLQLLETLEMRRNETVLVYAEVLKLPKLKHLLGKFELKHKPGESLKSGLETVTGFVTFTAQGFPQLMQHMKRLRKLKIYCTPTATETDQKDLETGIKAFTCEGMNEVRYGRSLSIDFNEFTISTMCSERIFPVVQPSKEGSIPSPLEFLSADGTLDSLKLRGDWTPFLPGNRHNWIPFPDGHNIPNFANIPGIKKLCLSRTYLTGEAVLAGLTNLSALEYLKLDEKDLGPLEIRMIPGTFQQLTRLCLVGETSLHGITIEHEALPRLASLHLICKSLHPGLEPSIVIGGVKSLNEIALDSEVDESIKGAWKEAAKGHPNRPQVFLIKKGAPIRQA